MFGYRLLGFGTSAGGFVAPTGGTITTSGGYTIHTFNSSGVVFHIMCVFFIVMHSQHTSLPLINESNESTWQG